MKLRLTALATVALVGALAMADMTPVHTQVNVPGIDKPVVVVSGRIRGTVNWTNNYYWVLRGAVFVEEGATLNIQAGTRVVGEAGSVGTLIVLQGGKLNAIGTREQPIVFTSDQAPGTRARGDWGGLIINGRAPLNVPGGIAEGEADTGFYGGNDPNDNSGSLRYVRLEFAGTEFSPDNELNGIAFQGTGRGGSYEYLQVHMNKDDAFEWFGGTADIKYAVASNTGDDSFDWTFGWQGRGQFLAVHQRGDDADAGIEADNNEFNNEFLPRSAPVLYNLTLCGDPDRNEGPESTRGMLLRRGTAGIIRNFIVMGFKTVGVDINGSSSFREAQQGNLQMSNGVIYLTGPTGTTYGTANTLSLINSGIFTNVVLGQDPGIRDCFNHLQPDFRPRSVATLAGGQLAPAIPPNDGFFEAVTFIGAVGPGEDDDWTAGWTAYPQQ
ncbi:MAG: T9SS C-terminal target domain-containing protein [Acidobacteria bacterium]|nr:T9SS C-terminal target domain-containing protein [Acidobacteriota bacterium]